MDDLVTRLRKLPDDTLAALAFFSRLPVPQAAGSFDLRTRAAGWPAAGFLLALGPAIVFLIARAAGFPPLVAAIMALALMTALTGAMHEDGLADTFDGVGGGQRAEEKLLIMRDSRLGVYGALALLVTILIKLAALAAIGARPGYGALALVMVAVASRALALWHWSATPPARSNGLAHAAGRPDANALTLGLALGGVAALVLLIFFGTAALIGILMAAAAIGLFSDVIRRQIGGHTGDTIGASQQIAAALLFAGLAAGTSIAP